jgi:hypothetical protein
MPEILPKIPGLTGLFLERLALGLKIAKLG